MRQSLSHFHQNVEIDRATDAVTWNCRTRARVLHDLRRRHGSYLCSHSVVIYSNSMPSATCTRARRRAPRSEALTCAGDHGDDTPRHAFKERQTIDVHGSRVETPLLLQRPLFACLRRCNATHGWLNTSSRIRDQSFRGLVLYLRDEQFMLILREELARGVGIEEVANTFGVTPPMLSPGRHLTRFRRLSIAWR